MKSYVLWVFAVLITSILVFGYLVKTDKPTMRPIIELSYYDDEQEVVERISQSLAQNFSQNKHFWLGVEPEKPEQIDIASQLIKKLISEYKVANIIVDQELDLKNDQLTQLQSTEVMLFKENLYTIGEKLQEFEKTGVGYIVLSASIYTNSFLIKNPINILKEKNTLKPLTISFAYFATSAEDEKNMMFPCRAEDHTGTSDWGCVVINRSRFARRKIKPDSQKLWMGLMDTSGEKDFVLMLKKITGKNDRF
ncbi:MAG: hypothetical protein AABY53_09400 [Bdellovibrionota bacterium]